MRKQWLVLLIAVLASAMLWGCGSSGGGGDEVTKSTDDVATAENVGNCTICHTLDVHTELNAVVGVNSNENGLGSAITHDCEACHGGGQYHHGDGPIPYPELTLAQCATCHTDIQDKMDKVLASKHNYEDAENTEFEADGHDTRYCQRCHTGEGSVYLKDVIGDKSYLSSTIVAYGSAVGAGQVEALQNEDADGNPLLHSPGACFTCHSTLTGELVQFDPLAWDPNQNGESDQLDMCTSCHNYKSADGTVVFGSGSATSGTAEFYHNTAWYRTISTTHIDNPATATMVEGYVIRETSANPCFDCHGHELTTNTRYASDPEELTIHTQWASSGHAAGLMKAKLAVDSGLRTVENVDNITAAGGDETTSGGGFTHYNWDQTSRASCQMCHTATGFKNYVTDSVAYNTAMDTYATSSDIDDLPNDFSHLSGWSTDPTAGSGQNELLYCWGCHVNAETGELRVTGAVTATYTYNEQAIVFPDVGSSNTCVVCHSGRGNNETASTSSRFAGHHAPAAADLFSEYSHVAYEYPGLDYSNVSYFAHDSIDAEGQGPCVACHMNGEATDHSFDVVEKDDLGVITAIKADVCVTCHSGGHGYAFVSEDTTNDNGTFTVAGAAAALEEEAEGYKEAGDILLALLANTITNYQEAVVNQSSEVENDRGAFQNSKLPSDEPGGFAHNRYYVKRAIFDAIDWMEDGAINGTIADYSATYPEGASWLGSSRP